MEIPSTSLGTGSLYRWSRTCRWTGTWSFNPSTSLVATRPQARCVMAPSLTHTLPSLIQSHVPLCPELLLCAGPFAGWATDCKGALLHPLERLFTRWPQLHVVRAGAVGGWRRGIGLGTD